jgi:membrane protease YdiL (CAAX protease family)
MKIDRRYFYCAVFVAVWMACGWFFRLSVNGYQLLGVPLVLFYQLIVARRPIPQLWVRDTKHFRIDWKGCVIAVGLAWVPCFVFWRAFTAGRSPATLLLVFCAIAGAVPAAFALRRQRLKLIFSGLPGFAIAIAIGCGTFVVQAHGSGRSSGVAPDQLANLLLQFLLMFPLCFIVEEVIFRGALDTDLSPSSTLKWRAWGSAIFVSALWGLWHLPTYSTRNPMEIAALIPGRLLVHILVGVPLSFCWRKSGTLALPAAAHALVDAYRNVIGGS